MTAYSGESNRDRIEAVLARRRSNAAGPHADRRQRRQRTRSAVRLSLRKQALS
jgi:hypothetical protein